MTFVKKPVALVLLAVAAIAFPAFAQTSALNPTVKVLARPQSPVPAECATDLSNAGPAIEPEPQEAVNASIPPSNDLRASLRRLQVAAEGNDYVAFKTALAEARRAAASHPPGGERNAANDALQVFADIGRVWDYAMASSAGSFFDSSVQGGSLLGAMKRYPDYGRTIAGETLVVGDKTLYPTRETRRFLARESSRRLSRLGVSTPARVAQGAQPEARPHRVTPAPPAKTKSEPKTTEAKAAPKPRKPVEKIAKQAPKPKPAPVPKKTPAPVKVAATQTVPPPTPPVVTTTTAAPPPAPVPTTTTAAVATQAPPTSTTAAPSTDTSTSASSATDTTATAAPDTAATSTAPVPEKQNGNMNLLLAVVLILVGIGVLVILFRASD